MCRFSLREMRTAWRSLSRQQGVLQALLSVCRQRLPLRRPSWRRAARERLRQRPRRPLLTKNKGLVCENPCFLGRFVQNFLP